MRKVVLLMHVSLDGFVAGPNGEMDWIQFDDELWEYVSGITDASDTALYGRITYQMMESYWPTAAENPGASKHDIDHSHWVNNVYKIVFSKTLKKTTWNNSTIIHENIAEKIQQLKKSAPGQNKNLLMIGSTSLAHSFMQQGLIDEYYLTINPVVLGNGMPLFKDIKDRINLKLLNVRGFPSEVTALHYETKRD